MNRLYARLRDKRFEFLSSLGDYDGKKSDLHDLLSGWFDHPHPITVFDLAGVPFEVVDLVVGMIARIIFEVSFWGRELPGIGRQDPLLMVFEEAHTYLPRAEGGRFIQGFAKRAAHRIFKEGRKYGVGGLVVSQRPSDLDETILAQCGTFFALRLSNPEDQGRVKSILPDALSGVIDLLPSLRTGEALVLGEAVPLPSRVRLPLIVPRPRSNDPDVAKHWKQAHLNKPPFAQAVTSWRVQQDPILSDPAIEKGK
jgi:DNA helicase HerA-like ATPase